MRPPSSSRTFSPRSPSLSLAVGCFVPAAKARIAPIDAIYSRMGANDFIFANASTFKVEMDDCNKILTKVRPRSRSRAVRICDTA